MIDKFREFIDDKIYNQLRYYYTDDFNTQFKGPGVSFLLKPYAEDYEYVKRQVCHFISSWDGPIYVSMYPDTLRIIVLIFEVKT